MAEPEKPGMMKRVMQKVSRVFNKSLLRRGSKKAEDLDSDSDFDVSDDELPLSKRENLLRRRDSRMICQDSFELRRVFPGLDINPRLIFDNPSIEQLSEAIVKLPDKTTSEAGNTSTRGGGSTAGESSTTYVSRFTQLTETGDGVLEFKYVSTAIDDVFVRKSDGMECVMIPAARARIGNDGTHYKAGDNEGPSHDVDLDSFLMDIEPVSVGAYVRFLNLVHPNQDQLYDWCILPEEDERCCHVPIIFTEAGWQAKPGVPANWPMILVSWYGANAYALWAHGCDWSHYKSAAEASFLPSEAQWEYAARGPKPSQFPWGDFEASEELLNVCWETGAYEGVSHVGTPLTELPIVGVNLQLGVSPFGLRGMAGNVWQWCRDTYHENFYLSTEASLPNAWNNEAGEAKSERGGSWVGPSDLARSSYRRGRLAEAKGRCLGFRCAVLADAPMVEAV